MPERAVLDTSVIISDHPIHEFEAAVSVLTITELHYGLVTSTDPDERATRAARLGATEATFEPIPVSVEVAREWGRLASAVQSRGGSPRKRHMDLGIAATAVVEKAILLTWDTADFQIVGDLVEVREPD